MERLIVFDAQVIDASEFYGLSKDPTLFVVAERDQALNQYTADETATMVVLTSSSRVDKKTLLAMPHLRLIVTLSTSLNHINLAECQARDITVSNIPHENTESVSEYTLTLMLSLARHLFEAAESRDSPKKPLKWQIGSDLHDQTLTVVGAGTVGRNVIRLARAFGMRVLAVDPHINEAAAYSYGFSYTGLHEGLKQADFLSLHVPLTPETKHIINRNSLSIMKPEAIIINTAHGSLIDTSALLHALITSKLGGAGLDTIELEEKLGGKHETVVSESGHVHQRVDHSVAEHESLLSLPNVIVTRQLSTYTRQGRRRAAEAGVNTIRAFMSGKPINVAKPIRRQK